MTAALGLDLVLNVEAGNSSADVLLDGAGNVDGATETGARLDD